MIKKNELIEMITDRIDQSTKDAVDQWENKNFHAQFFYIDDLLDKEIVKKIYLSFPFHSNIKLNQFNSFREKKKTFAKIDKLDPIIPIVTDAFHDKKIIKFSCRKERR